MRVSKSILDFFSRRLKAIAPEVRLFLFGSRNDDAQKGGDIDILVLTEKKIPQASLRTIRLQFYRLFGEQKIDLVNFSFADESPFKQLAMMEGTEFS
jgi:predicted nucleotidyltransferase